MRNKKLVVNLLNIGGIGILLGGIYLIFTDKYRDITTYFTMTKEQRDYLARNPHKNADNLEKKAIKILEAEHKKAETTILSVPVKKFRRTSGPFGELVSTDYIRVVVPSGPTCGDLANKVQQSYTNSYNQGKTPVRVQFYGTDNYYSVPLKSVEKGEDEDNVYIRHDIGEETENTWKLFPNKIVCRMRNASYVEYRPTGNIYCRDIVVKYDFDRNSFGYGRMNRQYCDESR